MDYFKQSEYYQMVARKEWEFDRMLEATLVEETEEEFEARVKRFEQRAAAQQEGERHD
jgi:hypothetical protein